MDSNSKVLVVFSGGFDSTSLLIQAVAVHGVKNVVALSFDYGQKHDRELKTATHICWKLEVTHHIIKMKDWGLYTPKMSALLRGSAQQIPHKSYDALGEQDRDKMGAIKTSVPLRNPLFALVASIKAFELGCDVVLLAVHMGDSMNYSYPDCQPATLVPLAQAISAATNGAVKLDLPYINLKKFEIAEMLDSDPDTSACWNALIGSSWSCYEGGKTQCGECSTCLERRDAFARADVEDPTVYTE